MATDKTTQERRRDDRQTIDGDLTVHIDPCEVSGPSQNVSSEGVYFTAAATIAVEVLLPDGQRRKGHIMRIGAVREGELGIAVRFDEPMASSPE